MKPVRVGVAGAGHWAADFHAPMMASSADTALSAVYGRRFEAAAGIADEHGAIATDDFEEFLRHCDAVAFALPPDVQCRLAPIAARAGKPLLLEKPLALTLDDAKAMVAEIDAAGVPTQMVLSKRYSSRIRDFLAEVRDFPVHGARTSFISGAFLTNSPFATPWRLEHGAVLDVGPHVLDLLDAVAGPIEQISFTGDPLDCVAVTTVHAGGAVGQAYISSVVPGNVWDCAVFGPEGVLAVPDADDAEREEIKRTIAKEFAETVRTGRSHDLDVHRGLYLQELIQG
ncbi:MAG: Gfo/Idh/MocA family oxidoreductase [Candidatus Nanopelagicales bacterium]